LLPAVAELAKSSDAVGGYYQFSGSSEVLATSATELGASCVAELAKSSEVVNLQFEIYSFRLAMRSFKRRDLLPEEVIEN
jgi:hypothetical protein